MNYYKFAVGMVLPLGWVKDLLCREKQKKCFWKRSGTFKRRIFQTSACCRTDLIGDAPTVDSSLTGLISEITMKPGEIDRRFKAFRL